MRAIEKILNYIFLIAIGLYTVILLVDTFSIMVSPENYRTAHGFIKSDLSWTSKSVLKYIASNVGLLLLFTLSFFIGVRYLQKKRTVKLWRVLYYLIFVGVLVLLLSGYWYWSEIGFDH